MIIITVFFQRFKNILVNRYAFFCAYLSTDEIYSHRNEEQIACTIV